MEEITGEVMIVEETDVALGIESEIAQGAEVGTGVVIVVAVVTATMTEIETGIVIGREIVLLVVMRIPEKEIAKTE
eukprot:gene43173-57447_t